MRRGSRFLPVLLLVALVAIGGMASSATAKKPVSPKKGGYYVGCPDVKNPSACLSHLGLKAKSKTKIKTLTFTKDPANTCKLLWGGQHNADYVKFSKIKKGKFSGTLVESDRIFELPQGDPGQVSATWKISGVFKSSKRAVVTFTPSLSKDGQCTADQLQPHSITYRLASSK